MTNQVNELGEKMEKTSKNLKFTLITLLSVSLISLVACNKTVEKNASSILRNNSDIVLNKGVGGEKTTREAIALQESGNNEQAAKMFKTACEKGEMKGCFKLGVLEEENNNKEHAQKFYKQACENDYLDGCYNLGVIYYEMPDIEMAQKLFLRVCDSNDVLGCFMMGNINKLKGKFSEAELFFKKACDAGYGEACLGLGHIDLVNNSLLIKAREINERMDLDLEILGSGSTYGEAYRSAEQRYLASDEQIRKLSVQFLQNEAPLLIQKSAYIKGLKENSMDLGTIASLIIANSLGQARGGEGGGT